MTSPTETQTLRALLRKSLTTIRDLNTRLATPPAPAADSPIAVIGASCAMPGGVSTPEQYWELLLSGIPCDRDGPSSEWLREVYRDYFARHPAAARYTRAGYLTDDPLAFDARYFNITPVEARDMDPGQRLALKLTVKAWEAAGYDPRSVGGRVGVYFGVIGSEYGALARHAPQPGPYAATGGLNSVLSGRVSHVFDYSGPAVSIDTACSSSLVAFHLACTGIRAGDCDTAVVGGVNLLLDPAMFTGLAELGALSSTGRCHSFGTGGDGYARGEGGGVLILKRLDDAQRDRDRVLAIVDATAVNHDGTASGLTVPNGAAQRRLLRAALRQAGRSGHRIDYLEAHGTGTALGDPIELSAVSDVLCTDRDPARPLLIGSVKSQIGHLEAAAGLAGLLKLILVLQHRRVPAQILPTAVNPATDIDRLGLRIPLQHTAIDRETIVAGVSSFGFSGTNAHVLLRSPDPQPAPPHTTEVAVRHSVLLSARSGPALTAQLTDLLTHLRAHQDLAAPDIAFTSTLGRRHHEHRMHVTAADTPGVIAALQLHATTPQFTTPSWLSHGGPVEVAGLLGTRAGTPPPSRRLALYREFAAFRAGFDAIRQAWATHTGAAEPNWLDADPGDPVEGAAAGLAHLHAGVELWRAFGVAPQIWCPEGIAVFAVAIATGLLDIPTALEQLARFASGTAARAHPSEQSSQPARSTAVAATIVAPHGRGFVTAEELRDPGYWIEAARTQADPATQASLCAAHGIRIGVNLELTADAEPTVVVEHLELLACPHDTSAARDIVRPVLLRLYELGVDLDWWPWYRDLPARRTLLPGTHFDEQSHHPDWSTISLAAAGAAAPRPADPLTPRVHTGPRSRGVEFDFDLDPATVPVADTHGLVHIGYFVDMLLRGYTVMNPAALPAIEAMNFTAPLMLHGPTTLRLILTETDSATSRFEFHSSTDSGQWHAHVHGTVSIQPPTTTATAAFTHTDTRAMTGADFYALLAARGVELGASVRLIAAVARENSTVTAELAATSADSPSSHVAPEVLDAVAQLFHMATPDAEAGSDSFVVRTIHDLVIHPGPAATARYCRIVDIVAEPGDRVRGSATVFGDNGAPMLEFTCVMRRLVEGLATVTTTTADTTLVAAHSAATASNNPDTEAALLDALRQLLADITGLPVGDIAPGDNTQQLGMDSLQASRLYRTLSPLGSSLDLAELVQGLSVTAIAQRLLPQRLSIVDKPTTPPRADTIRAPGGERILLCIPFGGGDTGLFRDWQAALPVRVHAAALPGRGARLAEPLIADIGHLVDRIAADLPADARVTIYGHSMGALIGYLLALRTTVTVEHLFVAACSSPSPAGNRFHRECLRRLTAAGYPHLPHPDEVRALDDAALRHLADLLGYPADLAASEPELLRINLPILANDIHVVAGLRHADAAVVDAPITAIHGSRDDRVLEADMHDWQQWTSGPFDLQVVDGDHFFLRSGQGRDHVLKILSEALEQ